MRRLRVCSRTWKCSAAKQCSAVNSAPQPSPSSRARAGSLPSPRARGEGEGEGTASEHEGHLKAEFYELADSLCPELRPGEVLLCYFAAEQSDFVRFNRGLVRQAGSVAQQYL